MWGRTGTLCTLLMTMRPMPSQQVRAAATGWQPSLCVLPPSRLLCTPSQRRGLPSVVELRSSRASKVATRRCWVVCSCAGLGQAPEMLPLTGREYGFCLWGSCSASAFAVRRVRVRHSWSWNGHSIARRWTSSGHVVTPAAHGHIALTCGAARALTKTLAPASCRPYERVSDRHHHGSATV